MTHLINIMHAAQHVKVGIQLVQHSHNVHWDYFVIGAESCKTHNIAEQNCYDFVVFRRNRLI